MLADTTVRTLFVRRMCVRVCVSTFLCASTWRVHVWRRSARSLVRIAAIIWELRALATWNPPKVQLQTHNNPTPTPTGASARTAGLPSSIIGIGAVFLSFRILRAASPPFGAMVKEQAELEGQYRFVHSRLITNAEEVAFYGGEQVGAVGLECMHAPAYWCRCTGCDTSHARSIYSSSESELFVSVMTVVLVGRPATSTGNMATLTDGRCLFCFLLCFVTAHTWMDARTHGRAPVGKG